MKVPATETVWEVLTRRGTTTFYISWKTPAKKLVITTGKYRLQDMTITEAVRFRLNLTMALEGMGGIAKLPPGNDEQKTLVCRSETTVIPVEGHAHVKFPDQYGQSVILSLDEANDLCDELGDIIRYISWGDGE